MKAVLVTPGSKNSARLAEIPQPAPEPGEFLVRILEMGIDSTDLEVNLGNYGEPPAGKKDMIMGHEALGVVEPPDDSADFPPGQLVVPVVRRPDRCVNCLNGRMDMCIGGGYRECGIKGADGYMREFITAHSNFLVKVPARLRQVAVLTEPTSVATKGITESVYFHHRAANQIKQALVLGAGSLGLLSTAILRAESIETYTMDILPESDPKAQLVENVGAHYIDGTRTTIDSLPGKLGNLDLIVEATGSSSVVFKAMCAIGENGVLCLMGVSAGEKDISVPADSLNRRLVLGNKVVFGSVNASRIHFEKALVYLSLIETSWPGWLGRLMTRRTTIDHISDALRPAPGNIKTIIEIGESGEQASVGSSRAVAHDRLAY